MSIVNVDIDLPPWFATTNKSQQHARRNWSCHAFSDAFKAVHYHNIRMSTKGVRELRLGVTSLSLGSP